MPASDPGLPNDIQANETAPHSGSDVVGPAALLTGMEDLTGKHADEVERRVLEWWESGPEGDCRMLAGKLSSLPESFMTVAFQNSTRGFAASMTAVCAAFDRYRRHELTFPEAMSHIGLQLSIERNESRSWRDTMDCLVALMRWQPVYERTCDYVRGALPTGDPDTDRMRSSLQEMTNQPHRFLEPSGRAAFDKAFSEFRSRYQEIYCRAHDETVRDGPESAEELPGVDRTALRNLELLSRLVRADREPLARVRAVLAWRRTQRCQLSVRTILEDSPRCCCNFIPGASLNVQASAPRLNQTIHEGIERLRAWLREYRRAIITDLESEGADESDSRQVAALLSQGSMVQLRPRTIEVLNSVLRRHLPIQP